MSLPRQMSTAEQIRFFGEPTAWRAQATVGEHFEAAPTGAHCPPCGEQIEPGDTGLLLYDVISGQHRPWHRDCFLTHIGVRRSPYWFPT